MKRRKSCGEYMQDRISASRDRQVESAFSDLERQAIRERLSVLSPDRDPKSADSNPT